MTTSHSGLLFWATLSPSIIAAPFRLIFGVTVIKRCFYHL